MDEETTTGTERESQRGRLLVSIPSDELTGFDLPGVCVSTGRTEGVEFRRVDFSRVPWWTWLLLACNVIVYLIVAGAARRHVRGELPFTVEAWRRWRVGRIVSRVAFLVLLVGFAAGFVLLARGDGAWAMVAFVAATLPPFAVHHFVVRPRGPVCRKLEPGRILLELPSAGAARAFEARLYGGASVPSPVGQCARHAAVATFACPRCGDYGCDACEHRVRSDAHPLCPACMDARAAHLDCRAEDQTRNMATWALGSGVLALVPALVPAQLLAIVLGLWALGRRGDRGTRVRASVGVLLGAVGLAATLALLLLSGG